MVRRAVRYFLMLLLIVGTPTIANAYHLQSGPFHITADMLIIFLPLAFMVICLCILIISRLGWPSLHGEDPEIDLDEEDGPLSATHD